MFLKVKLSIILNYYMNTEFYEKDQNSLTELIDYFKGTYIGKPNRRGHKRTATWTNRDTK